MNEGRWAIKLLRYDGITYTERGNQGTKPSKVGEGGERTRVNSTRAGPGRDEPI